MTEITHVIFDLGGTIVDFASGVMSVFNSIAAKHGQIVPAKIRGLCQDAESVKELFDAFYDFIGPFMEERVDKDEYRQFLKKKIFDETEFELMPGIDKLIKHLYSHKIPMAIATNAYDKAYISLTKGFGNYFDHYFTHRVCGEDDPEVKNNKPDPAVYLVCLKRFKTQPKSLDNVLIIEDSMTGIKGAVASKMKTLLMNDQKFRSFEPIANEITLIIDSFDNFKPETIGLPPYES